MAFVLDEIAQAAIEFDWHGCVHPPLPAKHALLG
jgi:hypothetical protein